MVEEIPSAEMFREAQDENTPAPRLKHLLRYPQLHLLLAANPATPQEALEQLSQFDEQALRRLVARNPNTSLAVLRRLAAEFPEEFLRNPLLRVLNMTQPDFVKKLPHEAWASLLRFADLSPAWFYQIQIDRDFQRRNPATWALIQLHVSQIDEEDASRLLASPDVRRTYLTQLPKTVQPPARESAELFLLFVMLFPYTAPLLKQQWVAAAREIPHKVSIALSLLPTVSASTLRWLAQDKHAAVLKQVARHPATSSRVIKHLAMSHQRQLASAVAKAAARRAAASNPHTPLETVYQMVSDEDVSLRRRAVTHPALEMLDLEIMALDQAEQVRTALATSPRLPHTLFAQLAADPAPNVRTALARNLYTPAESLLLLAHDEDAQVRAAAAGNPRLPGEVQAELLADAAVSVRASLGGNARLGVEYAALLAHDAAPAVRAALAANPRTPVSLLTPLLRAEEPEVWLGLARHPRLAPELLAQLALQGDQRTRVAVAAHARTPIETLETLAREYPLGEKTHELWCALAGNPRTPLAVLEQAIHTSSLELLHRLLHHPAMLRAGQRPFLILLAEQIQTLIARDRLPAWLRRAFLQYAAGLPVEIVAPFASSPYWQERYVLARRPHLPESILAALAGDGIRHVSMAARTMLEQRQKH